MGLAHVDIRPGVAAVLSRGDGRILLHRRNVGGGWPPSGTVQAGEHLTSALVRELREETGLEVEVFRLIGIYSDPRFQVVTYPDGHRIHFVTSVFACRAVGGEFAGSEEGLEWEWFSPVALPSDLLSYAVVWLEDALEPVRDVRVR